MANPNDDTKRAWLEAQSIYRHLALQLAENKCFFLQHKHFQEGETTRHMLAILANTQQAFSFITAISNYRGSLQLQAADIVRVLMNEVVIIVLLKPGKDALLPDSYRPISLLTTDVQLLARILATRLAKVVHKLVHRDPIGFIPTRSTDQNLRRLFLNLQILVNNLGKRAIFSLDAAKAFDSVE